ncbi:MAG: CDP-glucose 4,6-dehydratase [Candidatus Micrarchaeota archaeon]|nr:CDP-glucose 4,6-dehydratase [Candidatus Micrarchaeota archaeon]
MNNFFRNKTVLVTGHTGFVGSWLALWLKESKADVVGLSLNPPSNPYHYKILGLSRDITDIKGDIRKSATVNRVLRERKPDIVMHLAAQPILLDSYGNPAETYLTNVIGTLNVLEASRKAGSVRAFLNVTTDKVYENIGTKSRYKETDKLGGSDPYSSSKACSEILTQSYRDSFMSGAGIATARAGNILGGGDWGAHRLVPGLVWSHISGKPLLIRHPDAIRPWSHVLDILNGYLTLTEKLYKNPKRYSGPWNFASADVKLVKDLILEFSKYWRIKYRLGAGKGLHEEKLLLLDSTKAKEGLGWKPINSFSRTVRDTASWYDHFYGKNGGTGPDYSIMQLRHFERRLHG